MLQDVLHLIVWTNALDVTKLTYHIIPDTHFPVWERGELYHLSKGSKQSELVNYPFPSVHIVLAW